MKVKQVRQKKRFYMFWLHSEFTKCRNKFGYEWWDMKYADHSNTPMDIKREMDSIDYYWDDCGIKNCFRKIRKYPPDLWQRASKFLVRYARIKKIFPSKYNLFLMCTRDLRCEHKTWEKINQSLGNHEFYFIDGDGKDPVFIPITSNDQIRQLKELDELEKQVFRAKKKAEQAMNAAKISSVRKHVVEINRSIAAAKQAMEA